jgi:hypothetical protein
MDLDYDKWNRFALHYHAYDAPPPGGRDPHRISHDLEDSGYRAYDERLVSRAAIERGIRHASSWRVRVRHVRLTGAVLASLVVLLCVITVTICLIWQLFL